ncbi:MAG: proline--tRNA ligase [Treponema sp. CETP13]|nr:MAG: proline--tRNA ligase [Treponema sp. CETP13]
MKMSKSMISTLREVPADAVIASHQNMLRSGMIRKLGNGMYAYLPFGLQAFRKVENIIREEMNAIGSLEIKPSVVVPGELWKESGRWETMGNSMLRPKNRLGQDLVVSPTAEEAVTALVREDLSSYKQLPINVYQINTKFRDEIRPRYGVMRGREFTMKDAYSFHATKEGLDETYLDFEKAYFRIFKRLGLTVIPVRADSGAMGGSGSEEFMVESPVGDDTLIICPDCDYAANTEKASCATDYFLDESCAKTATTLQPQEVATPNVFSIDDMVSFFNMSNKNFIKALVYVAYNSSLDLTKAPGCEKLEREGSSTEKTYPVSYFTVLIRADIEVNEAKLAAILKASDVELANDEDIQRISGAPHGFVGPIGLNTCPIIADYSVMQQQENGTYSINMHDAIAGAGKEGYHVKHVEPGRDFTPWATADLRTVIAGDKCPQCGGTFYSKKGNELGHIFKLGYKYTESMNVTFLDETGKNKTPIMGCYGIGVDRALASIIEEHHDENGIIWPMSVAPYQVSLIPIKYTGEMQEICDKLAAEMQKVGIEFLLDDRNERPGVKFKDCDLLGIPIRIVIGAKNLPNVELKQRANNETELIPVTDVTQKTLQIIQDAISNLNS